ncbi:ATP-binding cassette domain-containing protein [Streptococcus pneumoniae]|uniref:ABC transporter ATP-binding protein n=1 Tax=Streptococcus pneumoniae TaxID=1313 RepID=UPI00249C93E7|nr:ATP-binding cassette domain-containing protein [Streptococcus pneumoniae]WDT22975.1 ATP-binding cassette domain-containing protein [Streptococcus pneumoniae]
MLLTSSVLSTTSKRCFELTSSVPFYLNKGKVYGFVGPNGAGKTTIIKMILGILKPDSGKITIFNQTVEQNSENILSRIGLVLGPSFYGHLDAYKNLKLIANMKGLSLDTERLNEYLSMVGLKDVKKKKVKNFSMGMKQRLSIAASLLGSPEILIWDEPINGLDPQGVIEIRSLIRFLQEKKGITFLISSHILSELDKVISDIIIINYGKVEFFGSCHYLLQKYNCRNLEEAYLACLAGGEYD